MPRKSKGVHTSPENAGIQNMPMDYEDKNDEPEEMQEIVEIWDKSFKNRQDYAGKWTEEELATEIRNYFQYCVDRKVKLCKAGLRLWLGISKSQYNAWENFPEKYTFKSDLIEWANSVMEYSYVKKVEKYPTGNIFLLKTCHDFNETTNISVTGQVSHEDVAQQIIDLGLKEKKE